MNFDDTDHHTSHYYHRFGLCSIVVVSYEIKIFLSFVVHPYAYTHHVGPFILGCQDEIPYLTVSEVNYSFTHPFRMI